MKRGSLMAAGVVIVAGLVAAPGARADDGDAAAAIDVASAYIFRGATVNDEVNVQPSLEGEFVCPMTGLSLTLGTWGTLNTDSSQFEEIDYYASFALPLGECPVGLSIGYIEYTYPTGTDADGVGLKADREVNVATDYGMTLGEATSLGLGFSANFGIEGPSLNDGIYLEATAKLKQTISDTVSVTGGATLGYEAGDNYVENGFSHLTLSGGASVGPISASINYVVETDEDVLAVDEDFYGVIGLSLPL